LASGDFIPTPAQVIIPGTPAGSFSSYTANESIRGAAPSEFWDNLSSDDRPLGALGPNRHPALGSPGSSHCNIGFYTTNTIGPDCAFKATGSTNVAAGTYTQYWQDAGTDEFDASAFSFSGAYTYDVTLKAAYSSGTSVVGYYYIDGTGRHFVPVPTWGNKSGMGVSVPITLPAGTTSWGFYLSGSQITEAPNCGVANTVCSDQNDNQHFALFLNTVTGTDYLVGVEDANLHPLWPASEPTNQDSDYQDYIFTVVPRTVVTPVTTWCSPGFWKNNGLNLWTAYHDVKYNTLVGAAPLGKKTPVGANPTLLEVISDPSTYGGPATNSVADFISNKAFGTPIGSGVESCPNPDPKNFPGLSS